MVQVRYVTDYIAYVGLLVLFFSFPGTFSYLCIGQLKHNWIKNQFIPESKYNTSSMEEIGIYFVSNNFINN